MSTTINQIPENFKGIEKSIFRWACGAARNLTAQLLMAKDDLLHEQRDKERYRDKGKRKTSVKTIYGCVEYERRVYETVGADGKKKYTYLLDESLQIRDAGLFSGGMVERMLEEATVKSFAASAETLREEGILDISAMGIWGVLQKAGERICREEEKLIARYKNNDLNGETVAPVLFEETDGDLCKNAEGNKEKCRNKDVYCS